MEYICGGRERFWKEGSGVKEMEGGGGENFTRGENLPEVKIC